MKKKNVEHEKEKCGTRKRNVGLVLSQWLSHKADLTFMLLSKAQKCFST